MKKISLIITITLIAIFQAAVLNHIKFFGAKPDLLLIAVVFFALYFGKKFGFWVGLLCGLLQDALSGLPWGTQTLVFSFCGLIIGTFNKDIYRDSKFVQAVLVFIFCIISYIFYYYVLKIKLNMPTFAMSPNKAIISFLYTSLTAPIFILLLNKLNLFLRNRFVL